MYKSSVFGVLSGVEGTELSVLVYVVTIDKISVDLDVQFLRGGRFR